MPDADLHRHRRAVEAFLAASHRGDLAALLEVLDPGVVLRADAAATQMGAAAEVHGAQAVAETFKGRALGVRLARVDGVAGLVWAAGGKPRVIFELATAGERIVAIDLLADPERLQRIDLELLDA